MKLAEFVEMLRKDVEDFSKIDEKYPDLKDADLGEGDWFEQFLICMTRGEADNGS